ncbi:MAG: RsmB/NOP family class I SAM-dependent RNA methyltransferase [Oligoflexia bacterium]|nr:RsmB/NOP family class I SAM-dependent RNA methyltransferase [Oligoflexia bacterium]
MKKRSKPRPSTKKPFKKKKRPSSTPYRPKPSNFRSSFETAWNALFTSPAHLDSTLSKAPPSIKPALADILSLLLRRPRSIAKFLDFTLTDDEPWKYIPNEVHEWRTAIAMADRLYTTWKREPEILQEGFGHPTDYPPWILEEWKKDFGENVKRELVTALAEPAPLFLRANPKKGRNTVLSALNDSNLLPVRAKLSTHSPHAFYFEEYAACLSHPLFQEGAYEIQDLGSQMMALFALWPKEILPVLRKVPGECRSLPANLALPKKTSKFTVIDTCAGAGGKSLAIAELLDGKGSIFAYDTSKGKLEALRKRAKRHNLHNIKTMVIDPQNTSSLNDFSETADLVLIDSPCSGIGVLRRNPDIKWRATKKEWKHIENLQKDLIRTYYPLVKPGGILVFGVCTIRKAETIQQVEWIEKTFKDLKSVGGGFYGPGPSDGFFMHAFMKASES